MNLTANLYDSQLKTYNIKIANLFRSRAERIRFSTQLPGGFATCSFTWPCSWVEAWDWYENYYFYRLVVSEGIDTVWEGRLEDVEMAPAGVVATFYGYWRNCYDRPYNDTVSYISGTHYADAIIKDMLLARCSQVNRDHGCIESPAFNLAPITFTNNGWPGDHIQRMSQIGDGRTATPWYFAIWEGRRPHFFRKKIGFSRPDWYVWKRDLSDESGASLRRSVRDMWNRVAMIYNTYDGMAVITDYADDDESQDRWGLIREQVVTMGEGGTETAAAARDAHLADHAEPQQSAGVTITGRVKNKSGVTKDLWLVRAGHVLQVVDLVPAELIIKNPQLDQVRTFYVKETDFDLDNYTLTVVPDFPGARAEVMLARADLGARW